MSKDDAAKLKDGDLVVLRDKSLYHGKIFKVIGKQSDLFIKLNMIERPVIVKTVHISQIEKEEK